MEKFCQNCRQPNPPNAAFCRHCASPLPPDNPQQAAGGQQGQFHNQQFNQQFPPQNPSGHQLGVYPSSADKASGRAIAAAALAVGGLFCCGAFLGVPAAILGWMEMSAIKEGRSSPKGMMFAQVGLWVGIVGSIITTIGGLLMMMMSGGGGYGYYGY